MARRRQVIDVPPEAWERLARRLVARRCELAPEWGKRTAFIRDTGLPSKIVAELETASRPVTEGSLARVDRAYGWAPGSCLRILNDEEPAPTAATAVGDTRLDALLSLGLDADGEAELELLYRRGDPAVREAGRILDQVTRDTTMSAEARRYVRSRLELLLRRRVDQLRRDQVEWTEEMDNIRRTAALRSAEK